MTTSGPFDGLDGFRVEVDRMAARADIVLDRPPLNVVSMPQRDQFAAVFAALDADEGVRVIVLRAEGKHFSSGGDIPGFMTRSPEQLAVLARNVAAPERCRQPVIAAIHGYCFGVAFELSLACDFRIVTEGARLGLPEQRIGMIPGSGGSARLARMIGIGRTKDMVMRARPAPRRRRARLGHRARLRAGRRARGRDRFAGGRAQDLLAARPAHRQEASQRGGGRAAPRRHRPRRRGLW